MSVTYYTGMVDTVAHVPERCVTADGYEPRPGENVTIKWPIARDLPRSAKADGDESTLAIALKELHEMEGSQAIVPS